MTKNKSEQIKEIKNWFQECDTKKVKPWEYDFKCRNLKENNLSIENPIKRIFEWYLDDNSKGEIEATDLAKNIYSILWDIDFDSSRFDTDIMNSFWSTYKQALLLSTEENYNKWKNSKINKETFNTLLKKFDNDKYNEINSLFLGFASKTHTLGNFTIETNGFNNGRKGNDYWDYALSLMKQSEALGFNFRFYVDKFFMKGYLNEDYSIKKLWDNHDMLSSLPKSIPDIKEFLKNVERNIEQRGIFMVKALCKKFIEYNPEFESELETYFFYGEIKENSTEKL